MKGSNWNIYFTSEKEMHIAPYRSKKTLCGKFISSKKRKCCIEKLSKKEVLILTLLCERNPLGIKVCPICSRKLLKEISIKELFK